MEPKKNSPQAKASQASIIQMEKGRIPPQATELEAEVLGAVMIDKNALNEVIDILSPESFYKESHAIIYESIKDLFGQSKPVDMLTVSTELKQRGKHEQVGGDYYLAKLTGGVSSSANAEYHARIIVQKHIQRELIKISNEIINDSYDETTDVLDLLDSAESKLFDVTQGNIKRSYESAEGLVLKAINNIEEIAKKEGSVSGIPSGFAKLDKVTAGWQPSDLVILAARPGMGKTAFVLSMARNITVGYNVPVAVFSLEMSGVQLITRLISSESGIESEKLRKGQLEPHEWEQLNAKVKGLEKAPLYIDDTPALSIFDLRAKCRRLKSHYDIQLIIIDYLQLMTAGGEKSQGNREQEISTISRSLKSIAKELNVPVIALSQLSREVEKRGGSKRPQLSDLRESGAIEQDADLVTFIYRPEYYEFPTWDDEEQSPCAGQAEIMIAKHRNGGLENVRLRFEGHLAKFSDLDINEFAGEFDSKMNQDLSSFTDDDPF